MRKGGEGRRTGRAALEGLREEPFLLDDGAACLRKPRREPLIQTKRQGEGDESKPPDPGSPGNQVSEL